VLRKAELQVTDVQERFKNISTVAAIAKHTSRPQNTIKAVLAQGRRRHKPMPMIAAARQTGAISALGPATPKVLHAAPVIPHSAERSISMKKGYCKALPKKVRSPRRLRKRITTSQRLGASFSCENIRDKRKAGVYF
jgi:hypothetical protein